MNIDSYILIVYFLFMGCIGFIFKNFTKDTHDYFKGGGKMLWWMVGATAFMVQFSAWTFTGAASKAYMDGLTVVAIFFGNALGYYINAVWSSSKFRRLNVTTPIEGIKLRYGKVGEHFFTWISFPLKLIQAGIWLAGLGTFVTAVYDLDLTITIFATGFLVVLISLVGGAWAIVASDFMQMLIIMSVALVTTIYALFQGHGITGIIESFPRNFIHGDSLTFLSIFFLWTIAMLVKQFASTNNLIDSYRFFNAKDTKNARKAAYLACFLMFIGPLIWFIPPWLSASMFPNLAELYPSLGTKADSAAYIAFVQHAMPAGMTGLLVAAIFSATMSSMDTGLNQNSGIFTRNFYLIVLRPNASEKELMKVAKLSTLVFGVIIILIAEYITNLKGMSLFKAMQYTSSLIALPMLVPLILGFVVKRVPKWTPYATIAVGFVISYIVANHIDYNLIFKSNFSKREISDLVQLTGVFSHLFITSSFFVGTKLFYKKESDWEYHKQVSLFFERIEGKNSKFENVGEAKIDNTQRLLLGKLVMILGGLIILLMLIPNPFWGRFAFLLCGGIVFSVGGALSLASKKM